MSSVITGLFMNHIDTAAVISMLENHGIKENQISIIASSGYNSEEFGIESHSKLQESVALGAVSVGSIGALVAGLTAVGTVATGGAGFIVAGPLFAALAGAGAGAVAGGVLGGIVGLAIPEHEIKYIGDAIKKGSVLIGVECEDSLDKDTVRKTFKHFNADKINSA